MTSYLKSCIKNLIKIGQKNDNIDNQTISVKFVGKTQDAAFFVPYGMHQKAPNSDDIITLLFSQEGNEDSLIAVATDYNNRDDITEDIGLNFGLPTLQSRVKFKDDERIVFKSESVEGGDFLVRFNELQIAFDELVQDHNDLVAKYNQLVGFFNGHTHPGVTPGSGSTGAVVGTGQTEIDSTATVEDAKIEKIEVPEL